MKTNQHRRRWRNAAVLVAGVAVVALAAGQPVRATQLLFQAEYNGNTGHSGLDADYSALGSTVRAATTGVTLTPSPFGGHAAYFPADTSANVNLLYNTAGNINSAQGTVEFWYRPDLGGQSEVDNNYRLFDVLNSDGIRFLDVYTSSSSAHDTGITAYNHSIGSALGDDSSSGFVAGTWVDVAVTWDSTGLQVFVNGKAGGLSSGTLTADTLGTTFSVGSYGSGGSLDAAGAVDHLQIYDYVKYTGNYTPEPIPVPEPGLIMLFSVGAGIVWLRRRQHAG